MFSVIEQDRIPVVDMFRRKTNECAMTREQAQMAGIPSRERRFDDRVCDPAFEVTHTIRDSGSAHFQPRFLEHPVLAVLLERSRPEPRTFSPGETAAGKPPPVSTGVVLFDIHADLAGPGDGTGDDALRMCDADCDTGRASRFAARGSTDVVAPWRLSGLLLEKPAQQKSAAHELPAPPGVESAGGVSALLRRKTVDSRFRHVALACDREPDPGGRREASGGAVRRHDVGRSTTC